MLTKEGGSWRDHGAIVPGPWSAPGLQLVKKRSDPGLVSGEESDATRWELMRYEELGNDVRWLGQTCELTSKLLKSGVS